MVICQMKKPCKTYMALTISSDSYFGFFLVSIGVCGFIIFMSLTDGSNHKLILCKYTKNN